MKKEEESVTEGEEARTVVEDEGEGMVVEIPMIGAEAENAGDGMTGVEEAVEATIEAETVIEDQSRFKRVRS